MSILLAADGSPCTKRMLAYVAAHDEWLGARHHDLVVTAVPAVPPRAASFLDRDVVQADYRNEAEKVSKPIRSFFQRQGIAAQFVHEAGHAANVIVEQATSRSVDLLLMGSHGHGRVANVVMGSVATKVIAGCKLPVLLVR